MIITFFLIYLIIGAILFMPFIYDMDYQRSLNEKLDNKHKLSSPEIWIITLVIMLFWPIPFCFYFCRIIKKLILIVKKK